MKLNDLINEVNTEQELLQACEKLCNDLTEAQHAQWEHCKERGSYYGVTKGSKYLKIVSYDDANGEGASVWGFINKGNPKFNVGDILKSAGWKTPALNKARGNILEGYNVLARPNRIYGPDYLI
tara:strand:+ start:75 stop:446 length:372 start_codon:yes stop_codon:yes gene_type:complete